MVLIFLSARFVRSKEVSYIKDGVMKTLCFRIIKINHGVKFVLEDRELFKNYLFKLNKLGKGRGSSAPQGPLNTTELLKEFLSKRTYLNKTLSFTPVIK